MIMKNKVIISIIPSIELQSVKVLLKGNFCSILIKCWIKSTPFLLKTGTFITLKNCIFMNDTKDGDLYAAFKDISYIGILQIQYITCEDFYFKFNLYLQFIWE